MGETSGAHGPTPKLVLRSRVMLVTLRRVTRVQRAAVRCGGPAGRHRVKQGAGSPALLHARLRVTIMLYVDGFSVGRAFLPLAPACLHILCHPSWSMIVGFAAGSLQNVLVSSFRGSCGEDLLLRLRLSTGSRGSRLVRRLLLRVASAADPWRGLLRGARCRGRLIQRHELLHPRVSPSVRPGRRARASMPNPSRRVNFFIESFRK